MILKIVNASGAPMLGITLLLGGLSAISPLSIDTFFTSLPAIAAEFDITSWQVQRCRNYGIPARVRRMGFRLRHFAEPFNQ